MSVVRFFHIRHNNAPKGGATVLVRSTSPNTVAVQVALCSQKDNFSRKAGRAIAVGKPMREIPLEALPLKLSRIARKVLDKTKELGQPKEMTDLYNRDYSFSTKYFTKKDAA